MGWVTNATPRSLYPREKPGTHCIEGWVGPRAVLDGWGKSRPYRDSGPSRKQRVAIPTALSRPIKCASVLNRKPWRSSYQIQGQRTQNKPHYPEAPVRTATHPTEERRGWSTKEGDPRSTDLFLTFMHELRFVWRCKATSNLLQPN